MSSIVLSAQWECAESRGRPTASVSDALSRWARDGVAVTAAHGGVLGKATIAARSLAAADREPLVLDQDGFALVADCRLDRGTELRRSLGLDGDALESAVLAEAYRRWGADLGQHVYGDFSLIVWDWRRRVVVAMRDALGTRPLYFWRGRESICVASDVEQILEVCQVAPVPDEKMVLGALLWRYQDVDRSFWAQISRLPGGHVLTASASGSHVRRYWAVPSRELTLSREDASQELRAKVFSAVARRLESDRPIVAQLSGGVDSSSIVCVADRLIKAGGMTDAVVHVASAVFPQLACDETPYIEAVRREIGLPVHMFHGLPSKGPDLERPPLVGPFSRVHMTGGVPGDLDLAASVGAATVLGGTGGDQLGSPNGVLEDVLRGARLVEYVARIVGSGLSGRQRWARTRYLLHRLAPHSVRQGRASRRAARSIPAWLKPIWRDAVIERERIQPDHRGDFVSDTQRRHWQDLSSAHLVWSVDNESRCAALRGVEVRYPFLDRELVEYVLSLPARIWPSTAPHVRVHREALREVLPAAIYERKTKAEFSEAIAHRIQIGWVQVHEIFHRGDWASDAFVDRNEARALLKSLGSKFDLVRWRDWISVWNIANVEAWLRKIFGYAPPGFLEGTDYER